MLQCETIYKRHKTSKAKLSLIPASRVTFHAAPLFLKQAPQCAVKSLAMFNIEDSFLKLLVPMCHKLEIRGSGFRLLNAMLCLHQEALNSPCQQDSPKAEDCHGNTEKNAVTSCHSTCTARTPKGSGEV